MVVTCENTECFFIDDSGTGGNDVISKTFVPNTVEDNRTNGVITPFYDMPGFDDTRSLAVEIANSFFIQKVIKSVEELKIIVLGKYASFTGTETTFKNLMSFLTKFINDPVKFKDSIIFIANMGKYEFPNLQHFKQMKKYLEEYKDSLGEDAESDVVRKWIDIFLTAPSENTENLERAAVIKTPPFCSEDSGKKCESVRKDLVYQNDYDNLVSLIWGRSTFTPVTDKEVGFTLSIEAEYFLHNATTLASASVVEQIRLFVSNIKKFMQDQLRTVSENPWNETNNEIFLSHSMTLLNLTFENCQNDPSSSPDGCIDQIRSSLSPLAEDINDDIFERITSPVNFLQFCFADVGREKTYDMRLWASDIEDIADDLLQTIRSTTEEVRKKGVLSLATFSNDVRNYYQAAFQKLNKIPIDSELQLLNDTITDLNRLEFRACLINPTLPLHCQKEILEKIQQLIYATNSNSLNESIMSYTQFLDLIHKEFDITVDLSDWAKDLTSIRTNVESDNENAIKCFYADLSKNISLIANEAFSKIQLEVSNTAVFHDILRFLETMEIKINDISTEFERYDKTNSLAAYVDLIGRKYSSLYEDLIDPGLLRLDVIYMIERIKIFAWFENSWSSFHKYMIVDPLQQEATVCGFLDNLFRDLVDAKIQSVDDLHIWRAAELNRNTTQSNFDTFWTKFAQSNVGAIKNNEKNKQVIKDHMTKNHYSLRWLNILLNYALEREVGCPVSTSTEVVFKRRFMTMTYVKNCLENNKGTN